MSSFDLIIRNGTVVTQNSESVTDIGITDGIIVALGPNLAGTAHTEINATGLHIFPALIDEHVHFNEPGRSDWEGIETGSQALAAGGGTLFFDMPLNSHPPTLNAESFDLKLAAARKCSHVDFAFWGGLMPENLDRLEELADRGVIGFKAFMSNSGIEDFSCADEDTLREGMKRAAKLGKLVAVHAESESLTSKLSRQKVAQGKISIRDYLDSRPVEAELEAIRRAIALAGETKCALHIVHVSSDDGVALVTAAQKLGVDVTCETCPHYLTLTDADAETLGGVAKCAPPLRNAATVKKLWEQVVAGRVTAIGSDHSPSPPGMKSDADFFKVWGGISGVQHTLPLLFTEGHAKRGATLSLIASLTSFNVATRFNLPQTKGRVETGADADFTLVNLEQHFSVRAKDLFYRHRQSPYIGRALTGCVIQTILRGQTVYANGKIISPPAGRLVKPQR